MSRTWTSVTQANKIRKGRPAPAERPLAPSRCNRDYRTQPRFKLYAQRAMVAMNNMKNMNVASHLSCRMWAAIPAVQNVTTPTQIVDAAQYSERRKSPATA